MAQPVHVTFIHGLANKPAPDQLRRIWLEALAVLVEGDDGFDLGAVGVTDSFVYWADLFYDTPVLASEYESRRDELEASVPRDLELDTDDWSQAMLDKFVDKNDVLHEEPPVDSSTEGYERIPIPWFIKQRVVLGRAGRGAGLSG